MEARRKEGGSAVTLEVGSRKRGGKRKLKENDQKEEKEEKEIRKKPGLWLLMYPEKKELMGQNKKRGSSSC